MDNDDPFAVLEEQHESAVAVADPPSERHEPIDVPSGSVFVFDLETIPDESRFPRPVPVEKAKRPDCPGFDVAKTLALTVPHIKATVPSLSEGQLRSLADAESAQKKPRAGVLDAIDAQIKLDNADDFELAMDEWKKLSFNPFGCRIVALGIKSAKHTITMLAKNDDEERALLNVLWSHIQRFQIRCGYNITGFDDAVLIYRSMILGIDATQRISRKKFGDRQSIDLMTVMFPTSQAQKLKEVCRMIGIVPPAGYEMSGDKVFDLVESGDWDGIANYVSSDAVIEFELYSRLADYLVF